MQTKTIAMLLLVAIATIGAIGIGIVTSTQSVLAEPPQCTSPGFVNTFLGT